MITNKQTIFDALGRHPIHPFPARMAPGIALEALAATKNPIRVLDPMMGSGTVLAMARAYGHYAAGVDIDPLAVLLARVWTTAIDPNELFEAGTETLHKAKLRAKRISDASAYPMLSNGETRDFLRYWFDPTARCQLTALSDVIMSTADKGIQEALWCAFSRLIITKTSGASLAMDLSHSRPHKAFDQAPVKPFDGFLTALAVVAKNCVSKSTRRGPKTTTSLGDARHLKARSDSYDLVLTSPPYLNAIDYLRCSKFSLVWMGHNVDTLRQTRNKSVGSEASHEPALNDAITHQIIKELKLKPELSPRHRAILSRYVWDMKLSLAETSRVLRVHGTAVYVVGDSTIRGTFVRNSEIVRIAGEINNLKVINKRSRTLPENRRYLPPPKSTSDQKHLNSRMRREVVITFQK